MNSRYLWVLLSVCSSTWVQDLTAKGLEDRLRGWVRARPYKESTEEGEWSEQGPEGSSPLLLAVLAQQCWWWCGSPHASHVSTEQRGWPLPSLEQCRFCQLSHTRTGEPCLTQAMSWDQPLKACVFRVGRMES